MNIRVFFLLVGSIAFFLIALLFGAYIYSERQVTSEADSDNVEGEKSENDIGTDEYEEYSYTIINVYPHDTEAFTQGLAYHEGYLYEGTGLNEKSSVRKVDLETGVVLQRFDLSSEYFGEGVTIYDDKIIQLTWQSQKGFVYDSQNFKQIGEFTYQTEGWGITHDERNLIVSDGTSKLYFWDPSTYNDIRSVNVYDENGSVTMLNELEYIDGKIYANVWQTDFVVMINPNTGEVIGRADMTGILESSGYESESYDVLNGIAYDSQNDRLFITGKLWPAVFEVELREK